MKSYIIDVTSNEDVPLRFKLTVDPIPSMTKVSVYDRRGDNTENGNVLGVLYAASMERMQMGDGIQFDHTFIDGPTVWGVVDWLRRQVDAGVWMV